MSTGLIVHESQYRACISACITQRRLSLLGRPRSAVNAFWSLVSCAALSELADCRNTIGRVSLPGTKCVPPEGGVGQLLGGSCAQAFIVEKRVLELAKSE